MQSSFQTLSAVCQSTEIMSELKSSHFIIIIIYIYYSSPFL